MTGCLDEATLRAFASGGLGAKRIAEVDAHLDGCEVCRSKIVELARARSRNQIAMAGTDLGALEAAPDPYVGRVLGERYRVLRKLGGGGMGAVYEAVHVLVGRNVAVKILHPQLAANREIVRRFQNEARAASVIGHEGIVEALDMGTHEGAPFLVLELLRGRSLDAEIDRAAPLEIARAVRIARQIAAALEAAHARGIVHRDLKPENVFLLDGDRVKVLDFGISKVASSMLSGPATGQGAMMGTPSYMAPEQFENAASADARSDVYSLGVVLYRALSGRLPHEADSLPALLMRVITVPPVPLSDLRADVPSELSRAVDKAMAPDRSARWPSMGAFAEVLVPFEHARRGSAAPGAIASGPERRVLTLLLARGARDTAAIRDAIESAGGEALVLGDARVIGLFGERTWRGDEPVRAINAALAARAHAAAVAVASGYVTRLAGSIEGEALAAAERACAAELTGVAVPAAMARSLEGRFALARVSLDVCEVAERGQAWSIVPDAGSVESPLLGRDVELAQLRVAIETLLADRYAVTVLVSGPPGIGKTRLAAELITMLDRAPEPVDVLLARADPATGGHALALLAGAIASRARWGARVRGWPRIDADAPADERRAAIDWLVRDAFAERRAPAGIADALAELLGVTAAEVDATATRARDEARARADRLRLAAHDWIAALARRGVVALLLEDLQWADAASLECVDALRRDLAEHPFLLGATMRADVGDERPEPFVGGDVVELRPRGLSMSDVGALAARAAEVELPTAIVRKIFEQTGGVPFFVEQIAAAIADAGGTRGELDSLPIPVSVEGAIQARLDALPTELKELCKRAAVLGRPFSIADLEAMGIENAAEGVAALVERDLISRSSSREGTREHRFRSALVSDVAYRMIPSEALAALHLEAARAVERGSPTDAESVARHLERAGRVPEAANRWAHAALVAASRADSTSVLRCAERALALGVSPAERFAVLMARADAMAVLGRLDDLAVELEHAILEASSPAETARALTEQGICALRTGHAEEAIPMLDAAVAAAESSGDAELVARALGTRGLGLLYTGQLGAAGDAIARAERIVVTRAPALRAQACIWRGQLAGATGDLGERRNAYWAAVELYREAGDIRNAAGAEVNLADAYNRIGAYEEAERSLTAALHECKRLGGTLMYGYGLANLAHCLTMLGRLDDAANAAEAACEVARETGEQRLHVFARLYAARIHGLRGDHEQAGALALHLHGEADAMRMGSAAVLALVTAARADLALGRVDDARERAMDALARRDALGGIEEDEAELFLLAADALEAAGDRAQASAILARARARLREIGARIGDPEWRACFFENVPAHRAILERTGGLGE